MELSTGSGAEGFSMSPCTFRRTFTHRLWSNKQKNNNNKIKQKLGGFCFIVLLRFLYDPQACRRFSVLYFDSDFISSAVVLLAVWRRCCVFFPPAFVREESRVVTAKSE